jgi:3-hydroxybutyryl-CoA dehydrogenase
MSIERVGVVGGGLMGAGIAEVCCRAACHVVLVEETAAAAADAEARILASMQRAVGAGKMSEMQMVDAVGHLTTTGDLDALYDRELTIEAITEDEDAKTRLFSRLDSIVEDGEGILASNTSSIPIMKLGRSTSRPGQVLGVHFFNPVPVLPLVEIVPSLSTSPAVETRIAGFLTQKLGKEVIRAADRAGFVVNALLIPYLLSGIRMLESGFATRDDIDLGMVAGCAHPLGPLALTDLIGLDTVKAVADSMYSEFRDPACAAPPLLCRMVEAGLLGRRSGQGFYAHRSTPTDSVDSALKV